MFAAPNHREPVGGSNVLAALWKVSRVASMADIYLVWCTAFRQCNQDTAIVSVGILQFGAAFAGPTTTKVDSHGSV